MTTELYGLKQTLAFTYKEGGTKEIVACLNEIGQLYIEQGNFDTGFDYLRQALGHNRDLGDKAAIAASLDSMGQVLYQRGNVALDHFRHNLALAREFNNEIEEVDEYTEQVRERYDTLIAVIDHLEEVHARARKLNEDAGDASCLDDIRLLLKKRDDIDTKLYYYGQALEFYRFSLVCFKEALSCFWETVDLAREFGDKTRITTGLDNCAKIYTCLGQYDEASPLIEEAVAIREMDK